MSGRRGYLRLVWMDGCRCGCLVIVVLGAQSGVTASYGGEEAAKRAAKAMVDSKTVDLK